MSDWICVTYWLTEIICVMQHQQKGGWGAGSPAYFNSGLTHPSRQSCINYNNRLGQTKGNVVLREKDVVSLLVHKYAPGSYLSYMMHRGRVVIHRWSLCCSPAASHWHHTVCLCVVSWICFLVLKNMLFLYVNNIGVNVNWLWNLNVTFLFEYMHIATSAHV